MKITDIFKNIFGRSIEAQAICSQQEWETLAIRRLCFWSCVNIVANAISVCEFTTYEKNKPVKNDDYYVWNVQPNKNQSSSEFIAKWIGKMFSDNEVLIIEQRGQLFIADSYSYEQEGMNEGIFKDIVISGADYPRNLKQNKVIYTKLADTNIKTFVDDTFGLYQQLLNYGIATYKQDAGNKGIVTEESVMSGDPDEIEKKKEEMMAQFKEFFQAESAIVTMNKGYTYKDISANAGRASDRSTRDIKAMISDIMEYTATAFGIPSKLLLGDIENTTNAVEQFLTFCIDPLADLLAEGINRKCYTQEEYLAGTRIVIDTKAVKHVDLLSVSNAIDKLIGSGAFNINDVREVCGEQPINEPWAKQHYITKNYETIEQALREATGGDSSDKGG
jgi:phage portal protein, HK97 family